MATLTEPLSRRRLLGLLALVPWLRPERPTGEPVFWIGHAWSQPKTSGFLRGSWLGRVLGGRRRMKRGGT